MKKTVLFFLLTIFLFAVNDNNLSSSVNQEENQTVSSDLNKTLEPLYKKLKALDSDPNLDNEWTKTYSTFITHKNLLNRKSAIEKEIKKYKSLRSLTKLQQKRLATDKKELAVINDKINLIKNISIERF